MGQYYVIVNLDKLEYLEPHTFGDGSKLLEFGDSAGGVMCGLAVLLADGNGRGGGDLDSKSKVVGSWKGDRIVIAGDYADPDNFMSEEMRQRVYELDLAEQMKRDDVDAETAERYARGNVNLYHACEYGQFKDVSEAVLMAMADDEYLKEELKERLKERSYVTERLSAKTRRKIGIKGPAAPNPEKATNTMQRFNEQPSPKTKSRRVQAIQVLLQFKRPGLIEGCVLDNVGVTQDDLTEILEFLIQQAIDMGELEECGCCGHYHRPEYRGDCRNDDERFPQW